MSPWFTAAVGAGAFSAIINLLWNTVTRKRRSRRTEAERIHDARHTALNIAIALEEFAYRCLTTIERAERANGLATDQALAVKPEVPPFVFPGDIQWRDLEAGKASYLRAFSVRAAFRAEMIQSNAQVTSVPELVAHIKGHCAELGRQSWLMAFDLREENALQAVEDHDCVIEFDAALSRYSAWKYRRKSDNERATASCPVEREEPASRRRAKGWVVGTQPG
jgi:hypothetical protein